MYHYDYYPRRTMWRRITKALGWVIRLCVVALWLVIGASFMVALAVVEAGLVVCALQYSPGYLVAVWVLLALILARVFRRDWRSFLRGRK